VRRHRFDPVSFAFGLAFLALSLLMSSGEFDLRFGLVRWLAAGFLLLLGVLMIATSRNGSRDRT
jgi:hypothetical protein